MIVVTVELWPHGDPSRKTVLGTAKIANDATGTKTRGNYVYSLFGKNKGVSLLRGGRIENFPRKRLLAWDLLFRLLREAFGERNQ